MALIGVPLAGVFNVEMSFTLGLPWSPPSTARFFGGLASDGEGASRSL